MGKFSPVLPPGAAEESAIGVAMWGRIRRIAEAMTLSVYVPRFPIPSMQRRHAARNTLRYQLDPGGK